MLYADYNATTPIPEQVVAKMTPYLSEHWGNPSSVGNRLGALTRTAVESARKDIAALVGCKESEVVFLSGGTESCGHAILGYLRAKKLAEAGSGKSAPGTIIFSSVEHPAVSETALFAADCGLAACIEVGVSSTGELNWDALTEACTAHPGAIVCTMTANNETGVLFPIAKIAAHVHALGCFLHTDAVQAVGKLPLDFAQSGADFLSLSAHKFGGPKGIGALIVRDGVLWEPAIKGGGQEGGRRGGTEAVAMIVALGEAARIKSERLRTRAPQELLELRNRFESRLLQEIPGTVINGAETERLCNTSSVRFDGINGQDLIVELAKDDIIVSAGSACASSGHKPSKVLTALGLSAAACLSTIRASFGFETTAAEVDELVETLKAQIVRQRLSSAAELRNLLSGK